MIKRLLILQLIVGLFPVCAHATYSIVACDAATRQCGVAVQTNNLAVGASVPYAKAGVGAVASQFETNPNYGPRGLALMAEGMSPQDALKKLLEEDGNFDGQGVEARQVGIVNIDGRAVFYTGQEAASAEWAGGRSGKGYSIQGNGLAGPGVVEAMETAFLKTTGALAERLVAALVAGDAAGGQSTGRESAALLVRTPEGFPIDIDLRVDHASDPVAELRKLYNMQAGRQEVVQADAAARSDHFDEAKSLLIEAVARASAWPRIWVRAARVANDIGERELALQYLTLAFSQSAAWAQQEIGSGTYAELGASPLFHRWVTSQKEEIELSAYRQLAQGKQSSMEDRKHVARMLLEAGHSSEAILLLKDLDERADSSADIELLRADAYAASGNYAESIKECRKAAIKAPNDLRVRRTMAQFSERGAPQR